jgi:transposase
MAIVHIGIDLAKNVIAVHGVDEHGKPALVRPAVARSKLHEPFAAHGHTVRVIAPKFVAPYRMSGVRGKNDTADAAANA